MRHRGLIVLAVFLTLSLAAFAVTPQFWENFSQEDLLKGSFKQLSLSSDGKLYFAPAYDLVYDTGQAYIFSMVRDKAGNLYVGTGDEGKVFKIDPQGKGSLYFQSKELNVFALALDSSDMLYVGTSPDGKVYRVTGANNSTEFCDPESKYIWTMTFDSADNLYVGTGANGIIYKVDKGGKKSVFYTCSDNHVVSFLRDGSNNLLAGTSPAGLIIQISPDGKGFALMDTPLEEVHAMAMDRFGTIYAVASSAKGFAVAPPKPEAAAGATVSVTAIVVDSVAGAASNSSNTKTVTAPGGEKASGGMKSAVYAITKDGSTETVYSSGEQTVYGATVRDDGSLLVATGPKGRLLSVDNAKQVSVISDFPEEDLTQLLTAGDVTFLAGSNRGKVYKLRTQRAPSGVFESAALDARTVASWGKISWHVANPGGANIELFTRTGNTSKADASWSDWSAPYTTAGQQITSPRARYLQWRASFKDGKAGAGAGQNATTDMLERVQIAYLQQNLRPQVTDIDVLPYGLELQKQPSLAASGLNFISSPTASDGRALNAPRERGKDRQPLPPRQVLQPGAQSFAWKAADENEDSLEYSLYFKGESEAEWKLLEKKLSDTFYTLNTASLPDGSYRLKVVASDAPSNPYDRFLVGELISDPFVIANAVPQIEVTANKTSGKKVEIQFRAGVLTGRIATGEFSIDGGEWFLIFPVDGIADSTQENYRILTPELAAGEHLIGLRASDGDGNTGTSKLVVRIP
jgi:sugar lactone lactonase YvrE